MRNTFLICCALFSLISGGCATAFHGEWLEDGIALPDGTVTPLPPDHTKLALKFDIPWTVRYGQYVDSMNVVDGESVQANEYYTFAGGDIAEFGAMIARREGNRLVLVVGNQDNQRHFTRVRGNSIFPPILRWPSMSRANTPVNAEQYAAVLTRFGEIFDAQEAAFRS